MRLIQVMDLHGTDAQRLVFPAASRNVLPIAAVLKEYLPQSGRVLEIASGSGEHAVAFQQRFKQLVWQASDANPLHCRSIDAWRAHFGLTTVMPSALALDVRKRPWLLAGMAEHYFAAFVCINLLHISPAICTQRLFEGAAELAMNRAVLIVYGPFMRQGLHTSESNKAFDASLRQRDPAWGLRDLDWVSSCALAAGWSLNAVEPMPANNFTLVFGLDNKISSFPEQ